MEEKKKNNRHIAIISYSFIIIFVSLIVYFAVFVIKDNSKMLNNPYNRTDDLLAERVIRGNIYTSDMEIVAETLVDDEGNEVRSYPSDNMFAHVAGYYDKGKTGLEDSYNYYMINCNDNYVTQALNDIKGEKNQADSLVTTLDMSLQKCAYYALGNRKGAVVVMDPDTGAVLAMVSKPDYNPNDILSDWNELISDEDNSPLVNRATSGLYPPGSTFKLVTLLAYIRSGNNYNKYGFECSGSLIYEGNKISCYNKKKHGKEDLISAFAYSCNCAFSDMGLSLDKKFFKDLCASLYFNTDLPSEIVCSKSSFKLSKKTNTAAVMQTSIGQGRTLISPMHNAVLISACANGGYAVRPYVVSEVINCNGKVVKRFEHEEKEQIIYENELEFINSCLSEVVETGTAKALSGAEYKVYGKTGTAEYNSNGDSHAWFIGYADYGNRKVAVSIIVEDSGTGSDYAVPIAKKIFDTL